MLQFSTFPSLRRRGGRRSAGEVKTTPPFSPKTAKTPPLKKGEEKTIALTCGRVFCILTNYKT